MGVAVADVADTSIVRYCWGRERKREAETESEEKEEEDDDDE